MTPGVYETERQFLTPKLGACRSPVLWAHIGKECFHNTEMQSYARPATRPFKVLESFVQWTHLKSSIARCSHSPEVGRHPDIALVVGFENCFDCLALLTGFWFATLELEAGLTPEHTHDS